jgi:hypothetical protein
VWLAHQPAIIADGWRRSVAAGQAAEGRIGLTLCSNDRRDLIDRDSEPLQFRQHLRNRAAYPQTRAQVAAFHKTVRPFSPTAASAPMRANLIGRHEMAPPNAATRPRAPGYQVRLPSVCSRNAVRQSRLSRSRLNLARTEVASRHVALRQRSISGGCGRAKHRDDLRIFDCHAGGPRLQSPQGL